MHKQNQLKLIQQITPLLARARVPHWLVGGWAVDFLVGEITRDHEDIDFTIWEKDCEQAETALAEEGFDSSQATHPDECVSFTKSGQKIFLFFLKLTSEDQVVSCGRYADWLWPKGSFADTVGFLQNVRCPVISARGQLDAKVKFPEHPSGAPLRKKDHADITRLRQLL